MGGEGQAACGQPAPASAEHLRPLLPDPSPPHPFPTPARRRPEQAAVLAATMLAYDGADSLTHDQHLHLLRFLCDCLLDSEKMRGVLQRERAGWGGRPGRGWPQGGQAAVPWRLVGASAARASAACADRAACPARRCVPPAGREDEALDAKRDVREEMAEQRKQLKELLDAGGRWWGGHAL